MDKSTYFQSDSETSIIYLIAIGFTLAKVTFVILKTTHFFYIQLKYVYIFFEYIFLYDFKRWGGGARPPWPSILSPPLFLYQLKKKVSKEKTCVKKNFELAAAGGRNSGQLTNHSQP